MFPELIKYASTQTFKLACACRATAIDMNGAVMLTDSFFLLLQTSSAWLNLLWLSIPQQYRFLIPWLSSIPWAQFMLSRDPVAPPCIEWHSTQPNSLLGSSDWLWISHSVRFGLVPRLSRWLCPGFPWLFQLSLQPLARLFIPWIVISHLYAWLKQQAKDSMLSRWCQLMKPNQSRYLPEYLG